MGARAFGRRGHGFSHRLDADAPLFRVAVIWMRNARTGGTPMLPTLHTGRISSPAADAARRQPDRSSPVRRTFTAGHSLAMMLYITVSR